jgi:hypothetical protein
MPGRIGGLILCGAAMTRQQKSALVSRRFAHPCWAQRKIWLPDAKDEFC